jgi:tRNA pseudouridine-54 N-methylase
VVRCHGMKSFQRKYTVIAVGREKFTEKVHQLTKEKNLQNLIFLTDDGHDVSSTQIRGNECY